MKDALELIAFTACVLVLAFLFDGDPDVFDMLVDAAKRHLAETQTNQMTN